MGLFAELNGQGITVVLVTHEPDIAAHAQRVLSVHDGLLRSDGPPTRPSPVANTAPAARNRPRRRPSITRRPAFIPTRRSV